MGNVIGVEPSSKVDAAAPCVGKRVRSVEMSRADPLGE